MYRGCGSTDLLERIKKGLPGSMGSPFCSFRLDFLTGARVFELVGIFLQRLVQPISNMT